MQCTNYHCDHIGGEDSLRTGISRCGGALPLRGIGVPLISATHPYWDVVYLCLDPCKCYD
nr:MAG TPA: hypothetical protein [Caudoviricetes sp.]